jgi:hypothetical protein
MHEGGGHAAKAEEAKKKKKQFSLQFIPIMACCRPKGSED